MACSHLWVALILVTSWCIEKMSFFSSNESSGCCAPQQGCDFIQKAGLRVRPLLFALSLFFFAQPQIDKVSHLKQIEAGNEHVIENWLHTSTDDSFPLALICHSAALMYNVSHHGKHPLCLQFFLITVDFERINLPHQWGNPQRCVELWEDWVQ